MIGIKQTKPDNCVQACVASIFELQLHEVPAFDAETWGDELSAWLEHRQLTMINIAFANDFPPERGIPKGLSLGAVATRSPRFPSSYKHCVVCRDGLIIWCPIEGQQAGTERAEEYTIFYPIDVAKGCL